MTSGEKSGYRPALDGLRAIAVAGVLFAHIGYYIAPDGFLGVDVFFVLSGFLITRLLAAEHQRAGSISLRRFYARRALRLYPALIAAVVGCLVFYDRLYGSVGGWWREAWPSLTYLMDIVRSTGYLPTAGPLGITWTLAVEEHFYLLWPLLLLVLLRRYPPEKVGRISLGIALVCWLSLLTCSAFDLVSPYRLYFRPDLRSAGLFVGCALALLGHRIAGQVLRRAALPAGLLLLVLFQLHASNTGLAAYAVRMPVTWLCAAVLVGAVDRNAAGFVGRVLAWAPLAYIGRISYGLYLYHLAIITLLAQETSLRFSVRMSLEVLLPIAVAAVSYRMLETPFLRLKSRFAQPSADRDIARGGGVVA
jgi:peptidoglycan/LPS O-acetylase OafA/YrhL